MEHFDIEEVLRFIARGQSATAEDIGAYLGLTEREVSRAIVELENMNRIYRVLEGNIVKYCATKVKNAVIDMIVTKRDDASDCACFEEIDE